MTREEHYQHGRAEGERMADAGRYSVAVRHDTELMLRVDASFAVANRVLSRDADEHAAFCIGLARGYRSVAR